MAFLDWRDRLLGNARFQHWAARFWLTRPLARSEAKALFDICAGFVYAQVLAACVALDMFERLARGPVLLTDLAADCAVPRASLQVLAGAGTSLRLLSLRGDHVRLGVLGAALRGNPGIAAIVAHHRLFYADLAEPVALLRGGPTRLQAFWPYHGAAGDAAGYSSLMAATQPMLASQILTAYDVSRHGCILDAGGGDGSFLRHAAMRAPKARLLLFDLPAIAALAAQNFAQAGLANRAIAFAGDLTADKLPPGADLITLIRVLHDHPDEAALEILKSAHAALAPGGTLLVAEPMAGTSGVPAMGEAYFGLYLLAMGSGRPRTQGAIEALLRAAGFSRTRRRDTNLPLLVSVVTAEA